MTALKNFLRSHDKFLDVDYGLSTDRTLIVQWSRK